jgi:hypothetical protein
MIYNAAVAECRQYNAKLLDVANTTQAAIFAAISSSAGKPLAGTHYHFNL